MNSYFYINTNGTQCGPFNPTDLKLQSITQETLVWCSGMTDWLPAGSIQELAFIFEGGESSISHSPIVPPAQPSGNYTNPQAYNNNQQQRGSFQNSLNSNLPIPKTWFIESILATVFCCQPFGIVGIVNANKVESLYYAGDYEGSERASKEAGKWTKIAFGVGFTVYALIILFYVGIFAFAISAGAYS